MWIKVSFISNSEFSSGIKSILIHLLYSVSGNKTYEEFTFANKAYLVSSETDKYITRKLSKEERIELEKQGFKIEKIKML